MERLRPLIKRMEENGAEAIIHGIWDWADFVFEIAQRIVPTDTGLLASTGEVIKNKTGASIVYTSHYARAVHYGYVRHFVRPRHRKALAWEPGRGGRLAAGGKPGALAFSKGHFVPKRAPRSKPNPWLLNSVAKGRPHLGDYLLDSYRREVIEPTGG